MSKAKLRRQDLLAEMLEEARWVQRVGEAGRDARASRESELDAMLEALMEAQQLRRRLTQRLAREREAS